MAPWIGRLDGRVSLAFANAFRARLRALATLGLALVAGCAGAGEAQTRIPCEVERVIDGDTFVCVGGERVRLLLVDAPEMDVEPLGPLARAFLEDLLPVGAEVDLEMDVGERDRFGRLLAYVYLTDGRMVNELLARQGFALTMVIPPNVRRVELIREAVAAARAENAGLWQVSGFGTIEPDATTDGTDRPGAATPGCDPSYPTVCIPPPPPDLECDDVPFRRFQVLAPDPHHFDGNGDGIGCEIG